MARGGSQQAELESLAERILEVTNPSEINNLNTEGDTSRILRSGKNFAQTVVSAKTSPSASHLTNNMGEENNPTPSSTPKPLTMGTLKLLPTETNIPSFSGVDPNYTALDFITLCEDVMTNSSVTEDADKIAFVRSRLQQGSRSQRLMQSKAFVIPLKEKDYKTFRERFLESFGDSAEDNFVQGVNTFTERILKGITSMDWQEGQIDAYSISLSALEVLKKHQWLKNGQMAEGDVGKFIEFMVFMLLLKPKQRNMGLSLTYDKELYDFGKKLHRKMKEKQGETSSVSVLAAAQPTLTSENERKPSFAAVTKSAKPTLTCEHCHRDGHTIGRCFYRRKERKQSQGSGYGAASTSPSTSKENKGAKSPTQPKPPQKGNSNTAATQEQGDQKGSTYCTLHRTNTHSTHDCFTVLNMRQKFDANRGAHPKQSGEASRPGKINPG